MATDAKSLRLKRRGAKAKLTRRGNAVEFLIDEQRPAKEITEAFQVYLEAYRDLQAQHEHYTELIDDEEEFNTEEKWMEECQETFLRLQIKESNYLGEEEYSPPDRRDESRGTTHGADSHFKVSNASTSNFKMEKPKMPKFTGDIREYNIFKEDFQHVVHQHYNGRDALMILRSCLSGKALEHIRGIGQDYDAAWNQLDLIYGDSRMVADAIINDISRFKPLKPGEDERFCDFVNLIRRSFNTLNEVGRSNDMDNNHMLAIIERKLCIEDRRLWFRNQGGETSPTLWSLLRVDGDRDESKNEVISTSEE